MSTLTERMLSSFKNESLYIYTIHIYIIPFSALVWLTTTLAMLGKFFCTITFFVIYIFTAELFPTVLRASVIGVASMTGRVGSISSAYVGELVSLIDTFC